jgi:hypothetical protein
MTVRRKPSTFARLACLPLAFGAIVLSAGQVAAADRVRLPTVADALVFAPNAESILFGPQGVETKLPGHAEDVEQVVTGFDTDGSIASVVVTQRLTLSGVGDFSFKIPGPARNVEPLGGSTDVPGLRKGAVLWQGFSPGRRVLSALVTLTPALEARRLPIAIELAATVAGRPWEFGRRSTGRLSLSLSIRNNTGVPIDVAGGDADAIAVAPVLDAIRATISAGRRPVPGAGGIPSEIDVNGTRSTRRDTLEVPVAVEGELVFAPGSTVALVAEGGTVTEEPDGVHVRFGGLVGGGSSRALMLTLNGDANSMPMPKIEIRAEPTLPDAMLLKPPVGATWARGVEVAPSRFDGPQMLALAIDTLWRVARLRQFDAYLGNPDVVGPAHTTYAFRLAPAPPEGPAIARPQPRMALPTAIALLLGGLLLVGSLAVVWARS